MEAIPARIVECFGGVRKWLFQVVKLLNHSYDGYSTIIDISNFDFHGSRQYLSTFIRAALL